MEAMDLRPIVSGLEGLQREMRVGSLANQVRAFSGDGSQNLRNWIRDMNKVYIALDQHGPSIKTIALRTLKDSAADFGTRLIEADAALTWEGMRTQFYERYSDLIDHQLAIQSLRRIKQNTGEGLQAYAERITQLGNEGYKPADLAHNIIQVQLKDHFIDGLRDKEMARHLLRKSVKTLDEALKLGLQDQLNAQSCALRHLGRRREEPMDIDMNIQHPSTSEALPVASIDRLNQNIESLMLNAQSSNVNVNQAKPARSNDPVTDSGVPMCTHCAKTGHFKRTCWALHPELKPTRGPTKQRGDQGPRRSPGRYQPRQGPTQRHEFRSANVIQQDYRSNQGSNPAPNYQFSAPAQSGQNRGPMQQQPYRMSANANTHYPGN